MSAESMRAAHGWLPLVVPAEARRFRTSDASLGAALVDAGAELVDASPEVEIGHSADELGGDAELGIVAIAGPESRAGHAALRAARRAAHSLRASALAATAGRGVRRKGYDVVRVVRWDLPDRVALPGLSDEGPRLPRYALVVGSRGTARRPAVLAALDAAVEPPHRVEWASTRAGLVVLAVNGALLRVALGPTRAEIDDGVEALTALGAADPPPEVVERVPWPTARGREGLADWSLERLLPGTKPSRELSEPLFGECLAFLAALGRLRGSSPRPFSQLATTVEGVCRPESVPTLHSLAQRLEERLAEVPRCFAHGDFFAGNVLEREGRLTGVVDWDAAGPGRLPLVDLLHLQLTRSGAYADADWGRLLLDRLLPVVRAGGDDAIRRYCRDVELTGDPRVLDALVFAYWLEHTAYQLRAHPVRRAQPSWIEGNVELVLRSAPQALSD